MSAQSTLKRNLLAYATKIAQEAPKQLDSAQLAPAFTELFVRERVLPTCLHLFPDIVPEYLDNGVDEEAAHRQSAQAFVFDPLLAGNFEELTQKQKDAVQLIVEFCREVSMNKRSATLRSIYVKDYEGRDDATPFVQAHRSFPLRRAFVEFVVSKSALPMGETKALVERIAADSDMRRLERIVYNAVFAGVSAVFLIAVLFYIVFTMLQAHAIKLRV